MMESLRTDCQVTQGGPRLGDAISGIPDAGGLQSGRFAAGQPISSSPGPDAAGCVREVAGRSDCSVTSRHRVSNSRSFSPLGGPDPIWGLAIGPIRRCCGPSAAWLAGRPRGARRNAR
jgi:hypothetical protein